MKKYKHKERHDHKLRCENQNISKNHTVNPIMAKGRRKASVGFAMLTKPAAVTLYLVLAPSPILARGVTTVPSDITGVDNHFPAGLFNWSSSGCGGGGVDFCGTLDFCQDGDWFGYALPGETTP